MCLNYGWVTEEIGIAVEMAMTFRNCYKDLIKTYCDWTGWVGPEAIYIDDCSDSSS